MKDLNKTLINGAIKSNTVMVIDSDGTQLGILNTKDAINQASDQSLDLVCVAPEATPPVCKILDFGKYKYQQSKKKKESDRAAKASRIDTKELWFRPNTDTHDIEIKVKRAIEFLEKGNRVKVGVRFRGRENTHKEQGRAIIDSFLNAVGEVKVEQPLADQGRTITVVIGKG